jgi:hypothetical protein
VLSRATCAICGHHQVKIDSLSPKQVLTNKFRIKSNNSKISREHKKFEKNPRT